MVIDSGANFKIEGVLAMENEALLGSLKQCQLAMLRAFIEICEKLDLRYYVIGGTLLGAVRHGGYIPWDDDIDLAMPRAEYDRFIKEGAALLPDRYFLQTFRTDPAFSAAFAKIRDEQTTFIERSASKQNIHHGVYIDIFPLDYYPDGWIARSRIDICRFFMKMRLGREFLHPEGEKRIKSAARKCLSQVSLWVYPDRIAAMECFEDLCRSIPRSRCVCSYAGIGRRKDIWPAEWILERCWLAFEDVLVSAPGCYHEMLIHFYGDYSKLPPPEERLPHHQTTKIDLERPYTRYMQLK